MEILSKSEMLPVKYEPKKTTLFIVDFGRLQIDNFTVKSIVFPTLCRNKWAFKTKSRVGHEYKS